MNHEKYRSRLVGFKGKRELTIVVSKGDVALGYPASKWESVFPQFSEQIAKFTGDEYVKNLKADFSTTTADSRLASEVILMESVKAYFDYRLMMIGCGISRVTIEGSEADWQAIMKKMDYMDTFDLQSWTAELRPIIQQIIQTKRGNVDVGFWSNMVQERNKELYAPHKTIDGWIVKFYPFDDKGVQRKLGPIVNIERIAAEYVKVPFILEDREERKQYPMEIWAGLFGMAQDSRDYILKPEIGWAVVHRGKELGVLPNKESYDVVSMKHIKELPDSFYGLKEVSSLDLHFIDEVNISDNIKGMKVRNLKIVGKINQEGIERLKILLPNTSITINDKEVSSRIKVNTWGGKEPILS